MSFWSATITAASIAGLDGMANFENSLVMSVDFVLPRARKGRKKPENLVAACRACNVIKGRRVFKAFEEAKAYVLDRRAELRQGMGSRHGSIACRGNDRFTVTVRSRACWSSSAASANA